MSIEQAICPECESRNCGFDPSCGELWCCDCGFQYSPPQPCHSFLGVGVHCPICSTLGPVPVGQYGPAIAGFPDPYWDVVAI